LLGAVRDLGHRGADELDRDVRSVRRPLGEAARYAGTPSCRSAPSSPSPRSSRSPSARLRGAATRHRPLGGSAREAAPKAHNAAAGADACTTRVIRPRIPATASA
jgi:hypothetical protein